VVSGAAGVAYAWTVDGEAVGADASYVHAPVSVGVDSVAVSVTADTVSRSRYWIVTVNPDESQLPPVVSGVEIEDGTRPAEVVVNWLRVTATHAPIVEYAVAISYTGPVTVGGWSQATLLGTVPHSPDILFNKATFGEADGITPGAQAWFAVRARDAIGQMSPITGEFPHRITSPWYLDVTVRDDAGAPLQNVILSYGTEEPATTDGEGFARLGPFRSVDSVTVRTRSTQFDILAEPRTIDDGGSLDLVLPTRYFLDHVSCGASDPSDFLAFLRHVTLTDDQSGVGKGYRLYRWERYPVSVWIPSPAEPHPLGWDLQALAAAALPLWNEALGEDYLVAAPDSLGADIVFSFVKTLPPTYNGLTELLEPAVDLGMAVPVRMRVNIDFDLGSESGSPQAVWITEVALHELGHTLGFNGHICVASVGNLMDFGGAIGSLAEGGVGEDEWHAVRAIRNIPQGTDMRRYDPQPR
jgi:hypothetical protein